MPSKRPSYRLHRASGLAVVTIDRKDHYLGTYDSPESRDRYDALITKWLSQHSDDAKFTLSLDELALLYLDHARTYYRDPEGNQTGEAENIRLALRFAIRLYGPTRAKDFGPLKLKQVRKAMIDAKHCRTSINRQVSRIRTMIRWAVSEELVPPELAHGLEAVKGLQRNRSEAVERPPVKPVPLEHVAAIEPYVSRPIWGAIRFQFLASCRPGEALRIRPCDVDFCGDVWEYRPHRHKTAHRGHERVIFIGPKAQDVLREFTGVEPTAYYFCPRAGRQQFVAQKYRAGANGKREGKRAPRERYEVDTYDQAIERACKKAGVEKWSANQLRHAAGTDIRKNHGLEVARVLLGHRSVMSTLHYAEEDREKARAVAGKVG